MKRREFIVASAALLVSPRRSWAQGTPRRVGTLGNFLNLPIKKVFDESLRGHGCIEGKNLTHGLTFRSLRGAQPPKGRSPCRERR